MQEKILVTGAYGRFGIILCEWLTRKKFQVFRHGRLRASLLENFNFAVTEFKSIIESTKPEVIVNLVANTDVDLCEQDPVSAYVSNVLFVRLIIESIRGSKCRLIHLSTDQVYSDKGLNRENNVNPINTYGKTKLEGELLVKEVFGTVLRVNYVGKAKSDSRQGFTDWLVDAFLGDKEMLLFDDIFFNPVHTTTLCNVIGSVIDNATPGTYNVSSLDGISKANFALKVARRLGFDSSNAHICSSSNVSFKAKRPHNMQMNSEKFISTFKVPLPTIEQTIEMVCQDYCKSNE